jgi:hypothetical protein
MPILAPTHHQSDAGPMQAEMAAIPKEDDEPAVLPETYSVVALEWARAPVQPDILPFKKKPLQTHVQPSIFRPFSSFTETELTVQSLRKMFGIRPPFV